MTNLNAVTVGQNKYCGPAVLSILTGRSTDECAYAITRVNGKFTIEGVTTNHLLQAASNLGFDTKQVEVSGSLFRVLTSIVNDNGIYIVMVPKHFVCIEVKDKNIYFCDNHTKEPMPAASSARLMMKVEGIYKVFPKPKPPKVEPSYIVVHMIKCTYCGGMASSEERVYHASECEYRLGLDNG